jgi:hypothetical protein
MFDFVLVLGLNEAEDVADGGTDHGEYDAGNHDSCEEHGFTPRKDRWSPSTSEPSREPIGKLGTESGFFFTAASSCAA